MNFNKPIKSALVWMRVVKHEGKKRNGEYITTGANPWNPLSYIVVFVIAILSGVVGFFRDFLDTLREVW